MTIYFYAKTDNRLDLDRLRRSAALAYELQKRHEVYFMTTEFRSATYAKRVLGIKKAVGIEDFRNVGTVCERGDILIYDSDEHNEQIHQEMIDYFGHFFRISYDAKDLPKEGEVLISPYILGENVINGILIDERFFEKSKKSCERLFFYGDSDYERNMLQIAPKLQKFKFHLLEGFYFFVDMADKLGAYFDSIIDSEEYIEALQSAKTVVTMNGQAALEAAATGAKVLYIQKNDEDEYLELLQRASIKNLGFFDEKRLDEGLLSATKPNLEYLYALNTAKVARSIEEILKSNP